MRAALIQMDCRFLNAGANRECAARLMDAVAADLYLLPELFTSGYTFADRAEVDSVAEPAADGPTLQWAQTFTQRRGAWVAYGFPERDEHGFYNSASLVGPDGRVGTYRKMHLFGREKLFFRAGDEPAPVWQLPFGRVGLMICFDWYFPEVCRSLALRGAQLILQPANLVLPHCPQAMITRSLENRVFTMTCDRIGAEQNGEAAHRFIGSSQIVTPLGEVLCRLSTDREETAVAELDLSQADAKGVATYNDLFQDRRRDLYTGL